MLTKYGVNDALAVKLWSKQLSVEALKATEIAPLIGKSKNAIIMLKDETRKSAGDKITCGLRMQLTGRGVTENEVLEGNEESLSTYSDALLINEMSHAVRVKGENTIDTQRILFNVRNEARDGLIDWYAARWSNWFFNQACGYTPQSDTLYTGNNAVIAPASGRQLWAGSHSNDQSITSSDTFNLTLIDYAKEMAKVANPKIRPVMVGGKAKYVMYIHPYQTTDLRTNTSTGQWLDIQKAAMQGGQVSKNPIYSGALGEYNGVILRESDDQNGVTQGVNASTGAAISTVRRAVLLGAQSAMVGFGRKGGSANKFDWVEETFDYQRELGVSAQMVGGLKKCVFNSLDFGTVVVSTYAAAHT